MAERVNPFSPGFSSRCAVSPVIAGEGVFMLHSFLLGVIITFIYDLFRIFRRIIPHGWFLLSLEDLVFWVLATAGIFYMLYYENNGMFRWFSVIGAGTGMFLYKNNVTPLRVVLAWFTNMLCVETFLSAFWLYTLYGGGSTPYTVYLTARFISVAVKCIPEIILVFALGKLAGKIRVPHATKRT